MIAEILAQADAVQQFENYQFMQYANGILLLIVCGLFGILISFFKKDAKETKAAIELNATSSKNNEVAIGQALLEIKHNREDTIKMIRILAEHTGANIGS